jgi:hypothetical protein
MKLINATLKIISLMILFELATTLIGSSISNIKEMKWDD